jgi:hypothetical protein
LRREVFPIRDSGGALSALVAIRFFSIANIEMQAMLPRVEDIETYRVTGKLRGPLALPGEATPEMYLDFAKSDLRRPYRRNRVNAVTNAKRGLHLQVDALSSALGIAALPKKDRRSFPQRLAFLSRCGIVTPTILERLNRLRNEVEHDYIIPDYQDARDFLDVVELFIDASSAYRVSFPHQTHFGLMKRRKTSSAMPKSLAVRIYSGLGEIRFLGFLTDEHESLRIMVDQQNPAWDQAEALSISDGAEFYDWIAILLSKG